MPSLHPSAAIDNELTDNRHRPPARTEYRTTDAPLIVTPTFLTRADNTPRAERTLDPGSTKGRHGQGIENPDAEPAEIALEADSNLAYEHWDEYWRKVHGTDNEPVLYASLNSEPVVSREKRIFTT